MFDYPYGFAAGDWQETASHRRHHQRDDPFPSGRV